MHACCENMHILFKMHLICIKCVHLSENMHILFKMHLIGIKCAYFHWKYNKILDFQWDVTFSFKVLMGAVRGLSLCVGKNMHAFYANLCIFIKMCDFDENACISKYSSAFWVKCMHFEYFG